MTEDPRVLELLLRVVDLDSEAREKLLDEVGADDPSLRHRVVNLLSLEGEAERILGDNVSPTVHLGDSPRERSPRSACRSEKSSPVSTSDPEEKDRSVRAEEVLAGSLHREKVSEKAGFEAFGIDPPVGHAPGERARYCIRCGREIGSARLCLACGTSNFYRDIPEPGRKPPTRQPRKPRGVRRAGDRRKEPTVQPSTSLEPNEARKTVPLQPFAVLRSVASPHREHSIYLGVTEIGARPPAQVIIDRPAVSTRHASLESRLVGGSYELVLTDRGALNGTYVNGERIRRRRIAPGDRIRFADVEFELRLLQGEPPRVTLEL